MQNTTTIPEPELDSSGGSAVTWIGFALLMTIIFGLLYPLVTTLLGQAIFPSQARGSLIERGGTVVGSRLIGQRFSGARYFVGRPSSAGKGYDPTSTSGSNLAASNPALRERATATSAEIAAREGVSATDIPVDLIAASGSGLDPHISLSAAALQIPRVAKARGIAEDTVRAAVRANTQGATLGVLGQARVNVLELNLALDAVPDGALRHADRLRDLTIGSAAVLLQNAENVLIDRVGLLKRQRSAPSSARSVAGTICR